MQRERRGRRGQGGSANTLSALGRADYETLKMTFLGLISVYRNVFLVFCHIILFYYDIAIILFCVDRSAIKKRRKKKIYIYIYVFCNIMKLFPKNLYVYRNVFLVFCPRILFYHDISVSLFCVQKYFSSQKCHSAAP